MGAVSGGSRVGPWASGYDPAVERSSDGQALQATARTARIFNQELGKLVQMRNSALANGEVVVQDRISLEFEARGLLLSARSGEALLLSKEIRQAMGNSAPALPPEAAETAEAAEPAKPETQPATLKASTSSSDTPTAQASNSAEPATPDAPRLDTRA